MINYNYICGECGREESVLVQRETIPIFKSEKRFLFEGGLCTHKWPTVEDKLPIGWDICLLGCCYCPRCSTTLAQATPTAPTTGAGGETCLPQDLGETFPVNPSLAGLATDDAVLNAIYQACHAHGAKHYGRKPSHIRLSRDDYERYRGVYARQYGYMPPHPAGLHFADIPVWKDTK